MFLARSTHVLGIGVRRKLERQLLPLVSSVLCRLQDVHTGLCMHAQHLANNIRTGFGHSVQSTKGILLPLHRICCPVSMRYIVAM